MKLGLKALVIALVMVLAAVPAAFAKNAATATASRRGPGKASPRGRAPGTQLGRPTTSRRRRRRRSPSITRPTLAAEDDSTDEVDLEGLNPAWYCKTLRDEMTKLERDFATMFGTNPNHANAFGKCVSRRAHGEDPLRAPPVETHLPNAFA